MPRQMKDSGIPYLGGIPASWGVQKLRYSVMWKSEKGYPDAEVLALYRDYGVIPKSSRDDNYNVTSLDTSTYKYVEIGDFVINKMKAWQGSMGVSSYSGIISPAYHVCSITDDDIHRPYFHYLLRNVAYLPEFARLSTGLRIGQWDLSFDDFRNLPFLLPDKSEQERIANLLDTKCADIDKVVEQTRATIEEYKKLKQAIITEAVTKGVRGPRPMKPSGVEWIGDIPEEWEVRKVSQFWKANKGPNAAQLTAEYCGNHPGAYPVYSGQTENNGVMGMIDTYSFDFGARGCLFSTTVGAKAMTVSCLYNKFSLSQNCMIMQPLSEKCDVRYYFYLFAFIFGYFRSLIPDYMQPSFRVKDFLSYCMLLPSVIEQQEIATYLYTKCAEIDRIIQKKEQLIEELGSYKKSLIYEYVTGKKEVTA